MIRTFAPRSDDSCGPWDCVRELAAAGVALPIVFTAGYGDIPMSVQAMKAGAIEFLTKPFRDQGRRAYAGVQSTDSRKDLTTVAKRSGWS